MRRLVPHVPLVALLAVVIAATRGAQGAGAPAEPFSPHFFTLFSRAGFGWSKREAAAWVTRDEARTMRLVFWPSSGKVHEEVWRGLIPAGVVALLHTHPPSVAPRPSLVDARTAARLGVPVYAIGRAGVFRVDADGLVAAVADDGWFAPCASDADCARRNAPPALVAAPSAP